MIGDLPATVCFDDGDIERIKQQVLRFTCNTLCENGRVLDDPEFVFGFFAAGIGESAHVGPRGLILDAT